MGLSGCLESLVFYYPSREPFPTPPGVEDVWFTNDDGLKLHGWFLEPRGGGGDGPRPTILHMHGNAGNVSSHVDFSRFLTAAGFNVLVFDYRGYGRSEKGNGRLTRHKLLADSRAALSYLLLREDVDRERIGVFGVSLGGVFAMGLAAESEEAKAVATLSAFSSWKGIARDHAGLLGSVLIPSGIDPADSIQALGARPVLIVHNEEDQIVPAHHAKDLGEAALESGVGARVEVLEGGGHNEPPGVGSDAARIISDYFHEMLGVVP